MQMRAMPAKFLGLSLRVALGAVFVFAGSIKILNPELFANEIYEYKILTGPLHPLINVVAVTLPWIELVAGLLLITGMFVRASALVAMCMSIVFFFAIASVLARGLKITCGCFGTVGESFVGPHNLAIDFVLLAVAGWLMFRYKD
jgi:uncharacterized membrane protein YphA (DoxX/SURF4 family)